MKKIIFLTLFPDLILSNTQHSILQKALEKQLLKIEVMNPRDNAYDKHERFGIFLNLLDLDCSKS